MTKDLRTSQLQTTQIIASGSSGTNARLVIYPVENQSTLNPNQGIIDPTKFNTSSIGTDVFLYISGGINKTGVANSKSITVFGGDVFISGNLNTSGSTPNAYWFSSASNVIFTTGSVEFLTGSDGTGNPYAYIAGRTIQNGSGLIDSEHQLTISASSCNVSGWGGRLHLAAGRGGLNNDGNGYGGDIEVYAGNAGPFYSGPTTAGGGNVIVQAGAAASATTDAPTGFGGGVQIFGGSSGGITAGTGNSNAAAAGAIQIFGGNAGGTQASGSGGNGGNVQIGGGGGGQSYAGLGGDGGSISITGGSAGFGSAAKAFHSASTIGNGGSVTIQAGSPSNGFINYVSGAGGNMYFLGGRIANQNIYPSGTSIQFGSAGADGAPQTTYGISRFFINASILTGSGFVGTDNFFFVSGAINGRNRVSGSVATFGGDVIISGNLYISGSKRYAQYITVAGYLATTASSSNPQVAGHTVISQSEVNTNNIVLRGVLSSFTGSVTASLKLYNLTSGSYVEIGGVGVTTLSTTNTSPTQVQSVNLLSATNFGTGSNIYETQVFTSNTSVQVFHGSSMFVCT